MVKKPQAILVAGLAFGDEAKGAVVDYLTRTTDASLIVRYNGGPQAAHHVVLPDGTWHCFSQFGAGTLTNGCRTYLSEFVAVDPLALEAESEELQTKGLIDPLKLVLIDNKSPIITPYHIFLNRAKEYSRGSARFGSVGRGVGETLIDQRELGPVALRAEDLKSRSRLLEKFLYLRSLKFDLIEQLFDQSTSLFPSDFKDELARISSRQYLEELVDVYFRIFQRLSLASTNTIKQELKLGRHVIFEGAQGLLLDREIGFSPHITQSRTTMINAQQLLRQVNYDGEVVKVGVMRPYMTRHGAGPFPTEDPDYSKVILEDHNRENQWQGQFRFGIFDLVALRYATEVCDVDYLALTNFDRLASLPNVRVCHSYSCHQRYKSLLSEYFKLSGNDSIIGIRADNNLTEEAKQERTKILFGCLPNVVSSFDPVDYKQLVDFIGSNSGLAKPVKLISFGPTYLDKLVL